MSENSDVGLETEKSRSLFAHEAAALDSIGQHVRSHRLGVSLQNLELHDPQSNRYFEVDLVVVSQFGVYVVELKHWSGCIEIRPNSWLQNGSFFKPDPHKANNFKAKLLKGIYERKFPQFPSIYFESVVVLTNPDVDTKGAMIPTTTAHNPTFDSIDRFLKYLKNQQKAATSCLSESQCHIFTEHVQNIHTTGMPRDFVFPGYEVVERLYQHVDRAEVIARRTDLRHRKLCRLRIFYPQSEKSESDRRRAHERATATLNAVQKVGDHPNILKVWDIPNENNYVVEGSDWSEMGTLRDVLDREGVLPHERATSIAVGLVHGLHAIYQRFVVHRALSPANILMVNDVPKLMNFDLSFQLEDDRVTVIPDATKLKRTPYVAPEIYGGDTPECTADLFSVGVILYEMLTGKRPFACSTDLKQSNGKLTDLHRQELANQHVPVNLADLVFNLVQQDPTTRPPNTLAVIERLETSQRPVFSTSVVNRQLEPGERSDQYEIESFVARGAESQVYRAVALNGRRVALKLFDHDVSRSRIVNEHRFSGAVLHPNLVRFYSIGQWTDERIFIAFDWVESHSLRDDIEMGLRPDFEKFIRVTRQLLDAISALHSNFDDDVSLPVLHNDIKPDNILLAQGNRPVLVDFGAASEPHVGTYEGTEGYVAPDLRLGQDRKYCMDGDLYAIAVTLHEWLVGTRPRDDSSRHSNIPDDLIDWLNRGSSTDATQRFASVANMQDALDVALAHKELAETTISLEVDVISQSNMNRETPEVDQLKTRESLSESLTDPNPFVPYLNSLHSRNAETDNALAESQARNGFFGYIHVSHPLVQTMQTILLAPERRHIIVTGHAGDGKSTIALELIKLFQGVPADQPLTASLQRRENLVVNGVPISFVKDFSEWSPAERADMLQEMLDPDGRRFFLISNTGTLLDTFHGYEKVYKGDWMKIQSDILKAMEEADESIIPFHNTPFSMFNIAMIDNLRIAQQIFERMLAGDRWRPCASADCKHHCPIYRNVTLIQANQAIVTKRLFLAYRRMYEYGSRLTLRQLCAHMAYMITSGLTYTDVVKMSQKASPPSLTDFMFFNRFFGDNGKEVDTPALQLRAVREVQGQGFGSQPCPTWERKLWHRSRGQSFQLRMTDAPENFELLQRTGSGLELHDSITAAQAREQVRRAVFFLHHFDDSDDETFLKVFLKSVMLLDFARWQDEEYEVLSLQKTTALKRRIMHVLQEHFTGVRLPENADPDHYLFVTLNRRSHDVRQSSQVVLARYPEDDFQVRLVKKRDGVGFSRRELCLYGPGRSEKLSLELALPFLDYVMMRNQGEVGRDLQASFVDRLERFKGQLIRGFTSRQGDNIMLVQLQMNNTFRRQILSVHGDRLEVTDG